MTRRLSRTIIAASLALIGAVAQAQSTDANTTAGSAQEAPAGTTATTTGATAVTPNGAAAGKLIAQFTEFAGSEENATSLVLGLRRGTDITLGGAGTGTTGSTAGATGTTSATTTPSGGSVTFAPPTKPMGYGNVKIALSLAQAQLAADGITQPTPEQLQAALIGGGTPTSPAGTTAQATATQSQGILQMRADGMGWGKIASSLGVKLGPVISGRVSLETAATAAQPPSGSATTAAGATVESAGKSKSAVTAAGASAGEHGQGYSRKPTGVVTAAGVPMGQANKSSRVITAAGGSGHAYGSNNGSSSRAVSAQGGGNGNAHGRSK